jgi:hypothetical protein
MKKKTTNEEIARLKADLKIAIKKNERLTKKLNEAKATKQQLTKELKKNDVHKVVLTKEQEQLLSNLSKDMDILNLLSD